MKDPATPLPMEVTSSVLDSPSQPVRFPKVHGMYFSWLSENDCSPTSENGEDTEISKVTESLLRILNPNEDPQSLSRVPPMVILAYDEAHILSDNKYNASNDAWSIFSEFRRAHRALNKYPIFSVFLSTSGKIQDLSPPPEYDKSRRLEDRILQLLPPFTELGFDQMIQPTISEGSVTIDDVSTIKYMAMFGRPL